MDRQQGLPDMTNQLTAYGRIGAKKWTLLFYKQKLIERLQSHAS
nr:MAG TPA: hypothetical protein [Caudoviricetes sp.]